MERQNVLLGTEFEELIGFSRAVRIGSLVVVGGTAPLDDAGNTVGIGDITVQTRRCFEIIEHALRQADASLDDVVRTRLILTDISRFREAAAVRKEFVGHVKPVDTIMQVTSFVNPDWLIEVEVDAVVGSDPTS